MNATLVPPTRSPSSDLRTLRGRIVRVVNLVAREEREANHRPLTWQPFANLQVTANQQKP